MSMNIVTLLYLVASICFIQALKGLSHPTTSIRGNLFGMIGMGIAVLTTAALIVQLSGGKALGMSWVLLGLVIGGSLGTYMAKTVEMTKMPELVAFMHSMIGLAAVFIAVATAIEPWAFSIATKPVNGVGGIIPAGNRFELALGAVIGAVTFSGSVIAFGKLSGKYKFRLFQGAPVSFSGQHMINLVLGLAMLALIAVYTVTQIDAALWAAIAIAFVLGVLIINSMLIIAGSLVGSSGAILSYIMCKAMNRSFFNVILGGFGGEAATAGGAATEQRPVKSGSADDAAFVLSNAETVIIVPGYGLAVARAQHAVKELAAKLTAKGITVKYAIHPVAGRMPGHMNVLLAEAEVPYDQVHEMEDINGEFQQADVAIILGANDVVNPAALIKGSVIYGMPILEAYKARTVIVNKRSMAAGYAGLDNELFYMDKTMMVFGDAKKVVEQMVKAVE
jgi:H+-translocating NAD(P) transhydrogenase subunit beta